MSCITLINILQYPKIAIHLAINISKVKFKTKSLRDSLQPDGGWHVYEAVRGNTPRRHRLAARTPSYRSLPQIAATLWIITSNSLQFGAFMPHSAGLHGFLNKDFASQLKQ